MEKADKEADRTYLSVGAVATRCGVAVSTIHFYESKGLVKSKRNAGNQRRYSRDVLRRIAVIKVAQRLGLPLSDIGIAFQALPDRRTPTTKDWNKLSAQWRKELDERIEKLTRLRDQLTDCIGCGCLSLDRCQLRNPSDQLGELGVGPQILDPSNNDK